MEVVFKNPSFYCEADEDKFFNWIYSIPAYNEVKDKGLDLNLNEPCSTTRAMASSLNSLV
ncbi:MAG: hypothetical protein P8X74_14710 [Reinekea sp.]